MQSGKLGVALIPLALIGSLALVQPALARPVSVANETGRDLVFRLRCSEPISEQWKEFRVTSGRQQKFNHKGCDRYGFDMTTKRDGMTVKVNYTFEAGTRHKLIYDRSKHAFDSRKLPGTVD